MKRTGYRYRTRRAAAHYDGSVIGGIGGLCGALIGRLPERERDARPRRDEADATCKGMIIP